MLLDEMDADYRAKFNAIRHGNPHLAMDSIEEPYTHNARSHWGDRSRRAA
jgi:hypothetical protein